MKKLRWFGISQVNVVCLTVLCGVMPYVVAMRPGAVPAANAKVAEFEGWARQVANKYNEVQAAIATLRAQAPSQAPAAERRVNDIMAFLTRLSNLSPAELRQQAEELERYKAENSALLLQLQSLEGQAGQLQILRQQYDQLVAQNSSLQGMNQKLQSDLNNLTAANKTSEQALRRALEEIRLANERAQRGGQESARLREQLAAQNKAFEEALRDFKNKIQSLQLQSERDIKALRDQLAGLSQALNVEKEKTRLANAEVQRIQRQMQEQLAAKDANLMREREVAERKLQQQEMLTREAREQMKQLQKALEILKGEKENAVRERLDVQQRLQQAQNQFEQAREEFENRFKEQQERFNLKEREHTDNLTQAQNEVRIANERVGRVEQALLKTRQELTTKDKDLKDHQAVVRELRAQLQAEKDFNVLLNEQKSKLEKEVEQLQLDLKSLQNLRAEWEEMLENVRKENDQIKRNLNEMGAFAGYVNEEIIRSRLEGGL